MNRKIVQLFCLALVFLIGCLHVWSRRFGGSTFVDTLTVRAVAASPKGDIVVAGYFTGTVDFGGATLRSAGGNDAFVAQYAGASGALVWARRFGGTGNDFAAAVAVDRSGSVSLAGGFSGQTDFGSNRLTSAGGYDVFVVRLSSSGMPLWSRRAGSPDDDSAAAVALTASGDVTVAGTFAGSVDLGGGPVASAGQDDVFVAQYDATTGAHRWSRAAGGSGVDRVFGVAVDDANRVSIIGTFTGSAAFGGAALKSTGDLDVFVAQYASADGQHRWSKRFGGTGDDYGNAVAAGPNGDLVVTGQFSRTIDFGGGPLSNSGAPDIYVARLSSSGAHIWSQRYGNASAFQEVATAVAMDRNGNVALGGNVVDAVDFGGGPLPISGGYDPVVVKLSPQGTYVWSLRFGSPQEAYNYLGGVAMDGSGAVLVAGSFSGTLDLGGGALANAHGLVNQSYDGFVAKYTP